MNALCLVANKLYSISPILQRNEDFAMEARLSVINDVQTTVRAEILQFCNGIREVIRKMIDQVNKELKQLGQSCCQREYCRNFTSNNLHGPLPKELRKYDHLTGVVPR